MNERPSAYPAHASLAQKVTQETSKPGVFTVLGEIDSQIEILQKAVSSLANTINPILKPANSVSVCEEKCPIPATGVIIVDRAEEIRGKLLRIRREVELIESAVCL